MQRRREKLMQQKFEKGHLSRCLLMSYMLPKIPSISSSPPPQNPTEFYLKPKGGPMETRLLGGNFITDANLGSYLI